MAFGKFLDSIQTKVSEFGRAKRILIDVGGGEQSALLKSIFSKKNDEGI